MSVDDKDNTQLAQAQRGKGQPITSANARDMALRSAEAKRQNRKQREERARELKALATLTPRERLRLERSDRWGAMADNLDEALAEGNSERAVRLYWDLVDQAYGKTATQVEVKAGPLGDLSEVPTEKLERRLAELKGSLELPEKTG